MKMTEITKELGITYDMVKHAKDNAGHKIIQKDFFGHLKY